VSARELCAGVLLAVLAWPAGASAQVRCTIGAFGGHLTGDDLALTPIGIAECDLRIPIAVSGLTMSSTQRYLDLWRADAPSASCELGTMRASSTTCESLGLAASDVGFTGTAAQTLMVTPRQLFGQCDTSATETLYLFDAASTGDVSTSYTTADFCTLALALDVSPPAAPTLSPAGPAGDAVMLTWSNPPDLGPRAGMAAYVDRTGCGGGSLVAGAAGPLDHRVFTLRPGAPITRTQIPTSAFGWSSTTFGEQVAIAITVGDSAGNDSVLSNVICVTHAAVASDAGMSAPPSGGGCACRAGRVGQSGTGWPALLAMAALAASRSRRRAV
jgi:MYXO-CTERM domain-containing protein